MPQHLTSFDSESSPPSALERQLYLIIHPSNPTNTSDTKADIAEQPSQSSWLSKLWQAIAHTFEQHNDDLYWEGYNPARNQTIYFASKDEARLWLD